MYYFSKVLQPPESISTSKIQSQHLKNSEQIKSKKIPPPIAPKPISAVCSNFSKPTAQSNQQTKSAARISPFNYKQPYSVNLKY